MFAAVVTQHRTRLIATAIAALTLLVVGLCFAQFVASSATESATATAAPSAIDVAQASRAYNDQRYLRNVRAELPSLSGVSDAELRTAALFTCAAYGNLSLAPYSWDKVTNAAQALMRYGYVTTSLLDAQKLAFDTSVTC